VSFSEDGRNGWQPDCLWNNIMIRNRYVLFFFRLIVGGMFIWSGILKIVDPLDFAQNITNYRVFPKLIVFAAALILPWIELFCGILLIAGIWTKSSAFLISGLLVCFLILILTTIIRGIDINCGCFGHFSRKVDYTLFLTDFVLLFLSLNILFSKKTHPA
jgi:uncharacterized membrane protein YphA (DoxX/SURF4 family)